MEGGHAGTGVRGESNHFTGSCKYMDREFTGYRWKEVVDAGSGVREIRG